jgi:outer membrane protein TolC
MIARNGKWILIFLCLIVPAALHSQMQQLSLSQAKEYAKTNAPAIKNARHDQEVAKISTDELLGIGLPQVNGSFQYQNFLNLPTSIVPGDFFGAPGQDVKVQFGVPHQATAGLSATQLLFDGTWLVGLRASRAYADLQSKTVDRSAAEVAMQAADAYVLAVTTEANVKTLEELLENLEKLRAETSAMQVAGFMEVQDVEQIDLSINEIKIQLNYTQSYTSITKNLLKFTMGMPIATEIELTDKIETLITTYATQADGFTPESHVDVQMAQKGLLLQQLNLKAKKAAYLPNLASFYNLQTQGLRSEFNYFDTSLPWFPIQLWGIQLNIPILSGGIKNKSVQKVGVEVKRMEEAVQTTKEAVTLEYTTATTEYNSSIQRVSQSESNLKLAKSILAKEEIKFREGVTGSFNITQRNQQVIDAHGQYIAAVLNMLKAKNKLDKCLQR